MPTNFRTGLYSGLISPFELTIGLALASSTQIRMTVGATETHGLILTCVYDQFLDQAGSLVNGVLWAEMLDEWTFFYSVVGTQPVQPQPPRFGRDMPRRWVDLGGSARVVMGAHDTFFGAHTPTLVLAGRPPAGIGQGGLAVEAGETYIGRVALAGDSPQPATRYPLGGVEPRVYAGSPTFPLDAAAEDRAALTVAVANSTEETQELALSSEGATLAGTGTRWRMAPESLDATVAVGEEPQVALEETALTALPGTLTLPSFSVSIYHLDVR